MEERSPQKAPVPKLTAQQLRSRLGKICVAITGKTADAMIRKAEAALNDVSFLEFRLDDLDQPLAALPQFGEFLARHAGLTAIATCRRSPNGGRFTGSIADQLDILQQAAERGFQLLDLEIESAEAITADERNRLRSADANLIVSYHDFTGTGDLDQVLDRMRSLAPDLSKIVPTAQSLADNLALSHLLKRAGNDELLIAMCMGERGLPSRILGPRSGSAFTFASTAEGEESAPGQLTVRTLHDLYRMETIDTATRIYGVAGSHVRSSLSPLMHNTAFRTEAINSVYLPLQVDAVDDLVRLTHELPLNGLSVTMPYKQQILPYLEEQDELSKRIGAVNTVTRTPGGKLRGVNTDVAGVTDPLEQRLPLRGARVLLLGAGGAARAAAFGLVDKGAQVAILNRTPEAAQILAKQSGATVFRRDDLATEHFDVLVNATPLGMTGFSDIPPLHAEELRADLVFDLVYNPLETPLLRLARQQGLATISGIEMFVAQGARQFELWTGSAAPTETMRQAVEGELLRTQPHAAEA